METNKKIYIFVALVLMGVLWRHLPKKLSRRLLKGWLLRLGRRWLPSVRARLEKEKRKIEGEFRKSITEVTVGPVVSRLDGEAVPAEKLESEIKSRAEKEREKWDTNTLSGSVYQKESKELNKLISLVSEKFHKSNLLHAEQFPAARQCEAELIAMTLDIYRSPQDACGAVTSGGTESILLAVKSYRDLAKKQRGISRPNMVVARTAHAAFWKAAEYFGMEVVEAEICHGTTEIDVKSVERLVNRNTILIVASAPSFPYGTVDPIAHLAVLATAHDIHLHVDACLGGFLLPFVSPGGWRTASAAAAEQGEQKSGGFWPQGVSSISCDPHKYGYTPKGCSLLLWRDKSLRHFQYSCLTDWTGGVYATPTICGSRPGFPAVAAWTTLRFYGANKYRAIAEEIVAVTAGLAEELPLAVPELRLVGRPDVSVVAFAVAEAHAQRLNVFDVADEMKKIQARHWQLNVLQNPAAVHIAVTGANADTVRRYFIADLRRAVNVALAKDVVGASDTAAFYGASAAVPIDLLDEFAGLFLDASYDLAVSCACVRYLFFCGHHHRVVVCQCLTLDYTSWITSCVDKERKKKT